LILNSTVETIRSIETRVVLLVEPSYDPACFLGRALPPRSASDFTTQAWDGSGALPMAISTVVTIVTVVAVVIAAVAAAGSTTVRSSFYEPGIAVLIETRRCTRGEKLQRGIELATCMQ